MEQEKKTGMEIIYLTRIDESGKEIIPDGFGGVTQYFFATIRDALDWLYSFYDSFTLEKLSSSYAKITAEDRCEKLYYKLCITTPIKY